MRLSLELVVVMVRTMAVVLVVMMRTMMVVVGVSLRPSLEEEEGARPSPQASQPSIIKPTIGDETHHLDHE